MLGGAAAGAALPVLGGLLSQGDGGRALAAESHMPGGDGAAAGHAGHEGFAHASFAAGRSVDHRANGFDPTELLRDFDSGRVYLVLRSA